MIPIRDHPEGATFAVRVQPRASRTGIAGMHGEALRITLAALPIDGRANDELLHYLADLFRVSRSAVHILAGQSGRNKIVRIAGRSAAELTSALNERLTA
jgi:uncharacterized protein (TIGR00251 family)